MQTKYSTPKNCSNIAYLFEEQARCSNQYGLSNNIVLELLYWSH